MEAFRRGDREGVRSEARVVVRTAREDMQEALRIRGMFERSVKKPPAYNDPV
jgi:hypothetical protein